MDERISMFIERVCAHLPWPFYRARVRRELTDHIFCRAEYLQNEKGFSPEEAVAEAVLLLGDPDEIGREFHKAHCSVNRLCRIALTCLFWLAIICCAVWLFIHM